MGRKLARNLLVAATAGIALVSAAQTDEAKLKAEFLVRFAAFTSWPPRAFPSDTAPVVIGVWKDVAFGRALTAVSVNRSAGARRILVRVITNFDDASEVHMLYIPGSHRADIGRLLDEIRRSPVLTVSEVTGFCANGGMINFYRQGSYLRFEANPDAARAVGIQLSSQLLKLAKIVGGNN